MEKKKIRTNLLSNPAVEDRILLVFFVLSILLIGTNWVIAIRALNVFADEVMALSMAPATKSDVDVLLGHEKLVLVTQLSVYSLLSLIMVGMCALIVSHHIGGPLYHLAHYCRGIAKGTEEPDEIHFRKHDIPHDLADAFNEFQRHCGVLPSKDSETEPKKD